MTKYAYYNSALVPNNQVVGWLDSELQSELPPAQDLLVVTEQQWSVRTQDIYFVVEGVLTASATMLSVVIPEKVARLSAACALAIIGGFSSSALGEAFIYASQEIDQRNLVQSAQCAKGGLLSCQDNTGTWARKPHTQAQAQQVLEDFVTSRDAARLQLETAQAQAQAATTIAAVQAIMWEG